MPKTPVTRSTRNSNKNELLGDSAPAKAGPSRSKKPSKDSQRSGLQTTSSSRAPVMDLTTGNIEKAYENENHRKTGNRGGKRVQSHELSSASVTTDSDASSTSTKRKCFIDLRLQTLMHKHAALQKGYDNLKHIIEKDASLQCRSKLGGPREYRALTPGESHPPIIFKADAFSNVEICVMVESLNSDIVTLCSSIADEISLGDFVPIAPHPLVVEAVPAVDYIIGALGRHFTHLLLYKTNTHHGNLIVRLALQSILSKTCTDLVQSWSMDMTERFVLQNLYSQFLIQSSNVAGHWRAMTRVRSKHTGPNSDLMSTSCERCLIDDIVKVLTTAGWKNFNAAETINSKYSQRVKDLVELVIKLDKATGEDVISQDLHVYTVLPDIPFALAHMTDQNKGPSNGISADDLVAVCTSIGLVAKCREPEDGSTVVGGVGPKEQILLKPIVILRSALEYIN
ncbi:hypothetical protein ARMSODRAFT_1022206 [Armillaria solidipes]|uniref:Uncharacterized protein n=1 Tax=Armillaria solidipes TaxID=1076256 RepID=A0A2H3BLG5_9AGAR|nr:hypothetical protein ARMSODRAFT_1022206 [Armillaria solidipes]